MFRAFRAWRPQRVAIACCVSVPLLGPTVGPAPTTVRADIDEVAVRPLEVPAERVHDELVTAAIDALVQEILARHDPHRHWEPPVTPPGETPQLGGRTALAALALIAAGRPAQVSPLREAIEWLRGVETEGTYAVAVRAMLLSRLADADEPRLRDDVRWLHEAYSPFSGGWDYRKQPRSHRTDNSVTQMAVLALWEAQGRGIDVDDAIWRGVADRFVRLQDSDGGWNYDGSGAARGSMVAAAVASLYIVREALFRDEMAHATTPSAPRQAIEEAIERGVGWLDRRFVAGANPGLDVHHFAYLFAVERLGLAAGRWHFAGTDWFAAGAAEVLRRLVAPQDGGGVTIHPRLLGRVDREAVRLDQLGFALLFLARGRIPVVMARLDDGTPATTLRPTSVPALLQSVGESLETELAWIRIRVDEPLPWPPVPILLLQTAIVPAWLASGDDPTGASPQLAAIREAVERGATFLVLSDGGPRAMLAAVEAAARTMFPNGTWRALPDDHPIRTALHPLPTSNVRVFGMSNGVRELILHVVDADWPSVFQARRPNPPHAWRLMDNLVVVGVENERALPRLPRAADLIDAPPGDGDLRSVLAVRTIHDGGFDPEPGAWRQLSERAVADGLALRLRSAPPAALAMLDPAAVLSVTTGVDGDRLEGETLDGLAAFLARGGTLLLDTAGGGDFAVAALEAIAERLDLSTVGLASFDLLDAELRGPIVARRGLPPGAPTRVRGVVVDGRVRAVASDDDLTHALLRRPWLGVTGFESDAAERIALALLRIAVRADRAAE